jgi:16S rRNA (cytosine967-C5)-methyltransferase
MTKRVNARSVALDVLVAVLKDDAYANLLLSSRISSAGLDTRDAGLATELCHGTLRGRGKYDAIISRCTDRELSKIHPVVLAALEMGCHQHLAMRVSTHALVNETVQLVKDSGMAAASGFANAVMRRVTERSDDEWTAELIATASSSIEAQSLLTSHPAWVIRAFDLALKADGRTGELDALLQADNTSTALGIVDLRLNGAPLPNVSAAKYSPIGFHLDNNGNPNQLTAQGGGKVRVQDEGSQLAALALIAAQDVKPGEAWLDMCAAPGGKSAVLAAAAHQHTCALIANEANQGRLDLVRRSVAPWPEVEVSGRDGRDFGLDDEHFDRILVDAPCTGLGALRRRPEARWRKTPADVATLSALQEQLLTSAVDALKPGGIVAYVTCSPHIAETRSIVNTVLKKRSSMNEISAREALNGITQLPIETATDGLSLQLWPHAHGTDAMFIALLHKSQ